MDIATKKQVISLLLWTLLSWHPAVWADEATDAAPLTQAEIDQFQNWLKQNKTAAATGAPTTAPPASVAENTVPPAASPTRLAALSTPAPITPTGLTSPPPPPAAMPVADITTPPPATPVTDMPTSPSPSMSPPDITTPPPAPLYKPKKPSYQSAPPSLVTTAAAYDGTAVITPPMSYNKSQQLMLQSAPKSETPPSEDSIDAFNAMMQQNVPLTPQQVVKLRQLIDRSQRAASIPANVPPKPVSSTLIMNLAPGTTPPAIRLAQGYVTSLVFVDSTGAPWPISSYDIGNPKSATIQWDQKSNIILIQAIAPYGDSDLIVRLVGLPTPLTLELVSGQRVVDYRTDIHVPGLGPNSKDLPVGTPLPGSANQVLLNVLDGIAPSGSRPLTLVGGEGMVWLLGEKMFVRSRQTVLSPGWTGRMVSPDGMIAYELPKTSTILVSHYGQPLELKVEGF